MCGRYALTATLEQLVALFRLAGRRINLQRRWNIAPTQDAPVIRLEDGERRLDMLRWGLVPYWAEDPSVGSRMINARGETVAEKPAYRAAFKSRRCLVPADAFYDWPEEGKDKRPFLFRQADGAPFAFAGLWEKWVPKDGGLLESFTIINCAAGPWMSRYHSRTPVLIMPVDYEAWLDPATDPAKFIAPPPDDLLVATRVSTYVNKPANEDANCFTPALDEPALEALAEPWDNKKGDGKKKKKTKPVDDRQTSLF